MAIERQSEYEPPNAQCNLCGLGLSYIENILYGNRCIFCAEYLAKKVKLIKFLHCAYYDWLIYQEMMKIKYKPDGRVYYKACLSQARANDINQVRVIDDKKILLKELRGVNRKC